MAVGEDRESHLELGLPGYLQESLDNYKLALERVKRKEAYHQIDCDFCELQADINCAEVDQEITAAQANYLRIKYLYD